MSIDDIALHVGHKGGSMVTETVYRKQIRPVVLKGAEAMDRISDAFFELQVTQFATHRRKKARSHDRNQAL